MKKLRTQILLILPFFWHFGMSQTFYDGTTTHTLTEKGEYKVSKCIPYTPFFSHYHTPVSYKSKMKKRGEWNQVNDSSIIVSSKTYQAVQIGELKVLVESSYFSQFIELENLCYSAILSIPYEQVYNNSKEISYSHYATNVISLIQYTRLKKILLAGRDDRIWIEVPKGHRDYNTCTAN